MTAIPQVCAPQNVPKPPTLRIHQPSQASSAGLRRPPSDGDIHHHHHYGPERYILPEVAYVCGITFSILSGLLGWILRGNN